jgi:lysophospholipase L1-like esterase
MVMASPVARRVWYFITMKRFAPWIVAIIAVAAFLASFSELQRMRKRFGEVTQHAHHDHNEVREFVITSQLAQAGDGAVVIVSDSIGEAAQWPSEVCGHRVINAGIGGATAASYRLSIANRIPPFKASVVVIALGTNDALSKNAAFRENYEKLVDVLKTYSGSVLIAGLPSVVESFNQQIRSIAERKELPFVQQTKALTIDGVHLSPEGYQPWMKAILDGIKRTLHC